MKELYPNPDYRREVEEYMQSLEPGWKEIISKRLMILIFGH
ncbi:hypothetical protein [Methanobacterium sp. ACI-7]